MTAAPMRDSLRFRLLLGTLFWIAVSIVTAGWGLGKLFRQHVEAQFHAELQTHLDQLTAQVAQDPRGQPTLAMPLSDPRFNKPFAGLYWQIDRIAGVDFPDLPGVLRSRSLWDETLSVPTDAPATGEIHRHRVDGPEGRTLGIVERSIRLDTLALRLIVAADVGLMVAPVARFNDALWLALGILGAGLALAAFMQVIIGLAPLRRLQTALGRVRNGEAQRLDGSFPSEVMPLVAEFNSVLEQNAEVVERARTQAGNLAHALKTPLSVLANAAHAHAGPDATLAQLVATQVAMARQQVDYHLARAQSAATVRRHGVRAPVEPVITGLVRTLHRLHAARNLELVVSPLTDAAVFRGEEHDLQEMLGNLIDNACKWAKSRVEIQVRSTAEQLEISIDDDGKGVPAELRDSILGRGIRADQQVPGTGLGLAIVADLARLYGGQLTLADSPLGGLRASLVLPAIRGA